MSEDDTLRYCRQIFGRCGLVEVNISPNNLERIIKCLPESHLVILAKQGFKYLSDSDPQCINVPQGSATIDQLCEESVLLKDSLYAYHKLAVNFKNTYRGVELLSKTSQIQQNAIQRTMEDLNQIKNTMDFAEAHMQKFKKQIIDVRLKALKKEFDYLQNEVESTKTILQLSGKLTTKLNQNESDLQPVSNSLQKSFDKQKEILKSVDIAKEIDIESVYCNWTKDINMDELSHPSSLSIEDKTSQIREMQKDRRLCQKEKNLKNAPKLAKDPDKGVLAKVTVKNSQQESIATSDNETDDTNEESSAPVYVPTNVNIQEDKCDVCMNSLKDRECVKTCSSGRHHCCSDCASKLKNECHMCRERHLQGKNPKFK